MKLVANKELYFNLMLFEGNAAEKLKEESGLFTVVASYIAAKDEHNININSCVESKNTVNEGTTGILTRLLTNGNIDYIIKTLGKMHMSLCKHTKEQKMKLLIRKS